MSPLKIWFTTQGHFDDLVSKEQDSARKFTFYVPEHGISRRVRATLTYDCAICCLQIAQLLSDSPEMLTHSRACMW